MAIAIDGQRFEDEFEYAVSQISPGNHTNFETPLGATQEKAFQTWKQQNAPNDSGYDYDLRGAFKAGVSPDPETQHWPDTFKKPWHPTFSDQSQYAKDAPQLAGTWEGEQYISPNIPRITVTPNPPITNPEDSQKTDTYTTTQGGRVGAALRDIGSQLFGMNDTPRTQLFPEKIAREIIERIPKVISGENKLPTRVGMPEGALETDPEAQKNLGAVFDFAGLAVMGPAPVAAKMVDGTLGSIAGVRSLSANRGNLERAIKMSGDKASADEIWKATGWYKGLEGKWRHEIPDDAARFSESFISAATKGLGDKKYIQESTLGNWVQHSELYKAYPQLKDTKIQIDNSIKAYGRMLTDSTGNKSISLNLDKILSEDSTSHPLEIVLHEIQHLIQREEGFNTGTNPTKALYNASKFLVERAQAALKEGKFEETQRLIDLYNVIKKDPKTFTGNAISEALYRRAPGEIEARTVQERARGVSPDEPPFVTSNILADPLPLPGEMAREAASIEAKNPEKSFEQFTKEVSAIKTPSSMEMIDKLSAQYETLTTGLLEKYGSVSKIPEKDFAEMTRIADLVAQHSKIVSQEEKKALSGTTAKGNPHPDSPEGKALLESVMNKSDPAEVLSKIKALQTGLDQIPFSPHYPEVKRIREGLTGSEVGDFDKMVHIVAENAGQNGITYSQAVLDSGLRNITHALQKEKRTVGTLLPDLQLAGGESITKTAMSFLDKWLTTPQSRAKTLGFTDETYHGSRSEWTELKITAPRGYGFYSTKNPELADMYAGLWPGDKDQWIREGSNTIPLRINSTDYLVYDAKGKGWTSVNDAAIQIAQERGKKGVIIHNVWDEPAGSHALKEPKTVYITLDPTTIRSKFAQFRAKHADLNNLLASGAALLLGGASIASKEDK